LVLCVARRIKDFGMGKGVCKYVYIYDNVSQHERFEEKESFVKRGKRKRESNAN